MMNVRPASVAALLLAIVAVLPGAAFAQQPCANPVGYLTRLQNDIQLTRVSTKTTSAVATTIRVPVCAGDIVETGDNSQAFLVFSPADPNQRQPDVATIRIDQNSRAIVPAPAAAGGNTFINLIRGALLYISRVRRQMEIRTPFVTAAIEGTEFVVRVDDDRATVTVLEGVVRATATTIDPPGELRLTAGQQAVAVKGQPLQLQIPVRPTDAVQWALYYEPLRPGDSFEQLPQVAAGTEDAAFLARRASLLLSGGQLEEARADLDRAQKLDPANADVLSLRAVIAVALNDVDGALNSGRQAVERAPKSAAAHLAYSYALQSSFDLEAARRTMEEAVAAEPSNASAWSRLAELRLMLDDLGGAAEAGQQAAKHGPNLSRTHEVNGFTSLARLDLNGAAAAFDRAIELDPGNPMAHLGAGLVKIRRGHLAEGRTDLETAVALSPTNALLRSYLGKAYFDEKRDAAAASEFDAAKTRDPNDPTAFFYSAVQKQTLNRPVEALNDLERSIQLNDNRTIYRSRLMVDEDLAARSAGLARIYRDLGFEQLALVEGWKSVDADPSDHAGHRFLADIYSTLPRHEVARVSELLQAQLLQPINVTPVSPRLAETDLFLFEGLGPDELAFNEFNPLFNRNRLAVQLSGLLGNESTLGEELTVSGVWNRLSFSAGQYHYDTDGLRANNFQDRDILNLFVQGRVSSATSIQAEVRHEDHRFGDLFINFDPNDFSPQQRTLSKGTTARIGAKQTLGRQNDLVASVYWRKQDVELTDMEQQFGITTNILNSQATEGYTAEVRHFLNLEHFRVTSGAGRFASNRERNEVTEAILPFPPFLFRDDDQFFEDPEQTNIYSYSFIDIAKNVTLTVGASADFYKRQNFERNQLNPKFGFTWRATRSTVVRGAAFRTLHRALVSNQTIEPTQVAGFSQFFADIEGVEAKRYGVAVDQKFGERLFAGVEYAPRDLRVPVEFGDVIVRRLGRTEQFGRAYGYWAPWDFLSTSVGYVFERFGGDPRATGEVGIITVRSHRVPFGLRYFSSLGFTAAFDAEHLNQMGTFSTGAGEDRFWVFNGGAGYRFPHRYGRIAFEVRNIFNREFDYQDTDPANPTIRPGRLAVLRFTVGI
jgi:tetratricopeptide (TPR) repeat protein